MLSFDRLFIIIKRPINVLISMHILVYLGIIFRDRDTCTWQVFNRNILHYIDENTLHISFLFVAPCFSWNYKAFLDAFPIYSQKWKQALLFLVLRWC